MVLLEMKDENKFLEENRMKEPWAPLKKPFVIVPDPAKPKGIGNMTLAEETAMFRRAAAKNGNKLPKVW